MVKQEELDFFTNIINSLRKNDFTGLMQTWKTRGCQDARRVFLTEFNQSRIQKYLEDDGIILCEDIQRWIKKKVELYSTKGNSCDYDILTLWLVGYQLTEDL